jgi:hypothetical protein
MSNIAMIKLAARIKLQEKISREGYSLEDANRAKRRLWLKTEFYKRSNSQAPDKYGKQKRDTNPATLE